MSGLARILRASGKVVTGSDREATPVTDRLVSDDFAITIGEAATNIPSDVEVVIHTTAAKPDANLELLEAKRRNLKILTYPEALGVVTAGKKLIAITGAHGKSTTTGLLISAALAAGLDISCLVGTNLCELSGGNARVGKSEWFILEACEYRRAFLNLSPTVVVTTNVEAEHLDYYRDLADYQSAFVELIGKLPSDGVLVADTSGANLAPLLAAASHTLDAKLFESKLPPLAIPGAHNRKNAALALAVATDILELPIEKTSAGIAAYAGAWRRFERRGEVNGAPLFDDYAHHPTEIRATLAAARERYPDRRIVVCYQQHQLDRATRFLSEIGASFADADLVVIPNIYRVRDDSDSPISGADVAREIEKNGRAAIFTSGLENAATWLHENVCPTDVVIVMGAGDVWRVIELLRNPPH